MTNVIDDLYRLEAIIIGSSVLCSRLANGVTNKLDSCFT